MPMTSAQSLADALGRKRMGEALGVGQTAISNAVVRGFFPPSWFVVMEVLAEETGVDCPPHLFNRMRLPPSKKLTAKAS